MVRDYRDFGKDEVFDVFLDDLQKESNRAAAVLAVSYLEDLLKQLLVYNFKNKVKEKELFEGMGALSTSSAKITMSYAYGLIDKNLKDDINNIRRIRNEFAHKFKNLSFKEGKIKTWCQNFNCTDAIFEKNPSEWESYPKDDERKLFDLAVALIALSVQEMIPKK